MTIQELKKNLHDKVEQSNDPDLLVKLSFMIDHKEKLSKISKGLLVNIMNREPVNDSNFMTIEDFELKYADYLTTD